MGGTTGDLARVQELFTAALERASEEREEFLASLDDPALQAEVRSLLGTHGMEGNLERMAIKLHEVIGARIALAESALPDLQQALGGRYRVLRELGRGGMATVYAAEDAKHGRTVAIKVLLPHLATALGSERFSREIAILAQLNHPHILTLIDSGEVDGVFYYVMPYVEGPSLRARLQSVGRLSLGEAVRLTDQVASALSYAHDRGVIHRDVKPENILVTGDQALVADFGIARAIEASGTGRLRDSGLIIGTPAYMSPEQAVGGEVDARADVYSLGCVAYEMLAGTPPFAGNTAREILSRHARDPVPRLGVARSYIPGSIETAVTRALAKQPSDRFATAAEFARALAAPAAPVIRTRPLLKRAYAGLAVLIVAGLLLLPGILARRSPSAGSQPSVGVLTCLNLSLEAENEYFSQGMADELITGLQRIPGLRVPALSSSLALDRNLAVRQVAETLGVSNVLECSVRRAGGRLKMTARLVRASDATPLWSEAYDRRFTGPADVIGIQEEIARAIVTALGPRLARGAGSASVHRVTDSAAYDLYLQGQYFFGRRTPEDFRKAIRAFEEAIRHDNSFALAHAGLSLVSRASGSLGYVPRAEAFPRATAAARRAVELDDQLAEAHVALGYVHYFIDFEFENGAAEFRRAIELNPNLAVAHAGYAMLLNALERPEDAAAEAHLARRLDPLTSSTDLGVALLNAGHGDEAIVDLERVVALEPDYSNGHQQLGRAYSGAGRYAEAIAEFRRALSLEHGPGNGILSSMGYAWGRQGQRDSALAIIRQLRERSGRQNLAIPIARVYLGLGDYENARAILVSSIADSGGTPGNRVLASDPVFAPLRNDPIFRTLQRGAPSGRQ